MKARVAADLKEFNRMLVYKLVRSEGSVSKTEIAKRLGLSVPTVITIIEYFIGLGLMGNDGEALAALGRRPMMLSLRATSAYAIGAEYDGVHLRVGLVDLAGRIHSLRRSPAPPDLGLLLGKLLADEVQALVRESGLSAAYVKGLGVGVPGVVHPAERYISQAPLVGVKEKVEFGTLVARLEERLGLPVIVANDANAAALGELAVRGTGRRGDLIFVELGRGVGAGLVLDGRLREGPGFSAGEIGYMNYDRGTGHAAAGPGWLESAMDLEAFWAEVDRDGRPSGASIERVGKLLALGLANLCIALDIRSVVLGRAGNVSFEPALLACLRAEINRLCLFEVACDFSVAAEPGVSGAAGLALDAWLQGVCAG